MNNVARAFIALFGLSVLFAARAADAHSVGLSSGEYRATAEGLAVEVTLARDETKALIPSLDANHDSAVGEDELAGAKPEFERLLVQTLSVKRGGKACTGRLSRAALTEEDGLVVGAEYSCPAGSALAIEAGFVNQLARGHRHAARLVSTTPERDELLYGQTLKFEMPAAGSAEGAASTVSFAVGAGYVKLGVEHIVTGYDHLLFLLALLLNGGRFGSLLKVITAFTVAHSLTIGLAVLGIWAPPERLVEPLIALSIAYVAVETLRMADAEKRWKSTFLFGLIHGFGFAGALMEANVSREILPIALFSFNVGVELGQIALLAIALPLVLYMRKVEWFRRFAVPALSVLIVAAGLGWFVERIGLTGGGEVGALFSDSR
jgi:hypothetical protein